MFILPHVLIVVATVLLMEFAAYAIHRWIMHGGWGWGWHKSHHEEREGVFEKNDLYAVCFAILAMSLFAIGTVVLYATAVGIGVTLYGFFYFVFHDGLVHHRWLFKKPPKNGYMKRLYQAHRMHHAVHGREGAVSFGFLYAPPLSTLKQQLQEREGLREEEQRRTLHS